MSASSHTGAILLEWAYGSTPVLLLARSASHEFRGVMGGSVSLRHVRHSCSPASGTGWPRHRARLPNGQTLPLQPVWMSLMRRPAPMARVLRSCRPRSQETVVLRAQDGVSDPDGHGHYTVCGKGGHHRCLTHPCHSLSLDIHPSPDAGSQ
jgi:hypothetical protein